MLPADPTRFVSSLTVIPLIALAGAASTQSIPLTVETKTCPEDPV